jgi:hypothetical protein
MAMPEICRVFLFLLLDVYQECLFPSEARQQEDVLFKVTPRLHEKVSKCSNLPYLIKPLGRGVLEFGVLPDSLSFYSTYQTSKSLKKTHPVTPSAEHSCSPPRIQ